MRKTLLALLAALLITAAAGRMLTNLGLANPYLYYESVSPPNDANPPTITVYPLENNTAIPSDSVNFTLTVDIQDTKYGLYLNEVWYQKDWEKSIPVLYKYPVGTGLWISNFSSNISLKGIPEGSRNITFVAESHGGYADGVTGKYFSMATYSVICFTIDTTSPYVSILSVENMTYGTLDILLNFTVNETVNEVLVELDGEENITVPGNTTLLDLSVGSHTLTVYARDPAGNVGASETVSFTVAEPETFPTVPVAAVSAVSIAVVAAGLALFTRRRRRKEAPQT